MEEILDWLEDARLSLVNTGINKFEHFNSLNGLCELEKEYEKIS